MIRSGFLFALSVMSFLLLSGCEEVIEVELDKAAPVVVIEGSVSDQYERQTVKISKTISFSDPSVFAPLEGAQVFLTSSDGDKLFFKETRAGIYKSDNFRGRPGTEYRLEVTAEEATYSATSRMPKAVKLDSLTFKRVNLLGNTSTFAVANYKDPASVQNQYRYVLKVNNTSKSEVVTEDRFTDGRSISDIIFYELDEVKTKDKLELELQCIDRNVFKYFFALQQMGSESAGPPVAPENPVSNFSNGALGIFSAHTSSQVGVIVNRSE